MTSEHLEDRLRRVLTDAASQLPVATPSPAAVMAAVQSTSRAARPGRATKPAWLPSLAGSLTLLAVLVAGGIGAGSIALLAHGGSANRPAARTSRPVVEDHLAGGKTALLAAVRRLRGQPVVITVWASWCKPCRRNLRVIEAASRRYDDVTFLGVDADDTKRAADRYLRSHPLDFPSYQASFDLRPLLQHQLPGIPATIFINRTGNLDAEQFGFYVYRSDLDTEIARIFRRGGGDPASDVLLGENVFYSYEPPLSASLRSHLNSVTATAGTRGFPIKVALISTRIDMGIIPQLFGKPQAYARYLDFEISFKQLRPLLVVMKNGYGIAGLPAAATAAAAKLSAPAGGTPNDLAAAALAAVGQLSAAAGHPLH